MQRPRGSEDAGGADHVQHPYSASAGETHTSDPKHTHRHTRADCSAHEPTAAGENEREVCMCVFFVSVCVCLCVRFIYLYQYLLFSQEQSFTSEKLCDVSVGVVKEASALPPTVTDTHPLSRRSDYIY